MASSFLLAGVLFQVAFGFTADGAPPFSVWAFPGKDGRMIRQPDALGNRVLDYSGVGYGGGTVPIPEVTVKTNLAPAVGDSSARIQAAINYVASLPPDASGFRGAVFLSAGEYDLAGSLSITTSGIVLRGAGDGTNGTILRATGTGQRSLIVISGSATPSTISGTTHNITNTYVPVGARSFNVDRTSGLSAGMSVFIHRPSPSNWIHDIGMDLVSPAWTAGVFDLYSDRAITRIDGNTITLDAPLTCALEQQYGGATIYGYNWFGRINNVGIEDLRGVSDFDPTVLTNTSASTNYYADENHAWTFIAFSDGVSNAWVRNVTDQYFGYSCVSISGGKYSGARNLTVRDCASLDPVSIITGSRRYAFVLNDCQFCLVQDCYTRNDRHQFVTQSLTTGPNVFVDGWSDIAWNDCGPHFRWATGELWDNVTMNSVNNTHYIEAENYGNEGTSHGWSGANEVVWNCTSTGGFVVQNPPTARNWLIGGTGAIKQGTAYVGPHADGTYDSVGTNVFPNSLFYAELQDRLAAPGIQEREYWLGQIDQFASGKSGGEAVPVNSTWLNSVQAAAGSAAVTNFDCVGPSQWVPFTFNYSLAPTDRIVGASLALAMRSFSGTATEQTLYLNALSNSNAFSSLGWLPIGAGTNTTARVLDLSDRLDLLTNGILNVAVAGDVGIDWALLELHVAPAWTFYTNSVLPAADAYVVGGLSAENNYGTNTTMLIKTATSANVQRNAYLRWSLTGDSPNFQQAVVRLTPVGVGADGYENGIALVTNNDWVERTINWNNQPGGGKRFATWIPVADVPVEITVTPQAQSALQADGQLSLELYSLSNDGGSGVTSYGSRENSNAAFRPQLLLLYTNPVPAISAIDDQTIPANTSSGPLALTVGDLVSPANILTLGAISSNPTLVPPANIVFGGSFSNRTVTVTPATGQTGSAQLTIVVTNSDGMTAGSQFAVTVTNSVSPVQPPHFTSYEFGASGNFNLAGTGPTNASYRIFVTTNLALPFAQWTAVATGIFSGGVFNFTDSEANRFPQRFYQVTAP